MLLHDGERRNNTRSLHYYGRPMHNFTWNIGQIILYFALDCENKVLFVCFCLFIGVDLKHIEVVLFMTT